MKKILILKSILKELARTIRKTKGAFKDHQRSYGGDAGPFYTKLWDAQREFRHKHIAYCLLRGTPREKIETLSKDPERRRLRVKPDESWIQRVMEVYREEAIHEDVCVGSQGS